MAFFTIRPRRISRETERDDLQATIDYLSLTKGDENTYQLANGNRLKLYHDQNGYALEPTEK